MIELEGRDSRLLRVTEACAALAMLVVMAPILIVAALVSAVQYRAWPFFTHDRVGLDGETISVTKVRTLPPATYAHLDKYQLHSIGIPRLMKRIRKAHLDELPQLWLVITGSLSFVGPRPEMRTLHDRLAPMFARERTSVRPGITGLWQVGEGVVGLIGESPEYDQFYVRNRTLRLDLWILYRTVLKVIFGTVVTLDEVPVWALRSDAGATRASVEPSTGSTV